MTMADASIDNKLNKVLALLNGTTGLVNNVQMSGRINNTFEQDGIINDIDQVGRNLTSFDDISSAYSRLGIQPQYDFEQIRGMDTKAKVGSVLTAAGTGAQAGSAFGPWGAVAGTLVGAGAGLYGVVHGDEATQSTIDTGRLNALVANNHAQDNLNASSEYATEQMHRDRIANLNSKGGQIRRSLTAKEFADKVLGRQKTRPVTSSSGLVIKKCDGGAMIRIKR